MEENGLKVWKIRYQVTEADYLKNDRIETEKVVARDIGGAYAVAYVRIRSWYGLDTQVIYDEGVPAEARPPIGEGNVTIWTVEPLSPEFVRDIRGKQYRLTYAVEEA